MDILEKLEWRYATKKFDSQYIIPEEKIDQYLLDRNMATLRSLLLMLVLLQQSI